MDFRKAIKAKTADERESLIRDEIENHSWFDDLDGYLENGGWIEDDCVDQLEIDESDEESFVVDIDFAFSEVVGTSCSDVTLGHQGYAKAKLTIEKATGHYELEFLDGGVKPFNDYDGEDDYFPDDYL